MHLPYHILSSSNPLSVHGLLVISSLVERIRRPTRPQQKDPLYRRRNLRLICDNIQSIQKIHLIRHPESTPNPIPIELVFVAPMLEKFVVDIRNRQSRNHIQREVYLSIGGQNIWQFRDNQVCFGASFDSSAWDAVTWLAVQADGRLGGCLEVEAPMVCFFLLLVRHC